MQILKRCGKAGCRELIQAHETYCDKHQGDGNREYNRARYRNDPEYIQFYNSKEWRDLRYQALLRDEFMCQHCLEEGKFVEATLVHHIVETRDDWSKRLDIDNLVSLCEASHNWVHSGVENKWLIKK